MHRVLKQIEQTLKEGGPMTATMLARQLKASEQAVDGMLTLLVARGRVAKVNQSACSGSCCGASDSLVLYQWQGKQALPLTQL